MTISPVAATRESLFVDRPMSAIDIVKGVSTGALSTEEIWRQTRAHIAEIDPQLKAFVCLAKDAPRTPAYRLDRGLLAGLPVAIKDILDTADMTTAYGSRLYENHRPATDASIVAALRQLGALIVGKTATTEFAAWPPAITLNPHDPAHTPGGSSAGSAAAVAAGLVPIALGSQTLGSVIRPASFCGVVGFKPSRGRLSTVGLKALAESLDTVGLFGRSVADVRLVFEALVPAQAAGLWGTPRLAFCRDPNWSRATADAQVQVLDAIATLRQHGLAVDELTLPSDFGEVTTQGRVIHDYESARTLLPEMLQAAHLVSPSMREGIARSRALTADQHAEALAAVAARYLEMADLMEGHDALVCLAAPGEAPRDRSTTGDPVFNIPWTALAMPVVTVPAMRGANGMPIGLQIIGRRFDETRLLDVAGQVEAILCRRDEDEGA